MSATVIAPHSPRLNLTAAFARVNFLALGSVVTLVLAWQLLAETAFRDVYAIAAPVDILVTAVKDFDFIWPNLLTTAGEAGWGWLLGNVVAVTLAALSLILPWTQAVVMRVGVIAYCLPIVAISPILVAVTSRYMSVVLISAQGVFFTTLVGAVLGLHSASATRVDVIRAAGGGRGTVLRMVQIRSAVPALFAALRVAAPLAVLGAMIGEYLGADKGLGVAMVYSQQSLNVDRTWALALYAALLAAVAYGLTVLAEKAVYTWRDQETVSDISVASAPQVTRSRNMVGVATQFAVTLLLVFGGWYLIARSVDPYFGKTPVDVWNYLTSGRDLSDMWAALRLTIVHTVVGFASGLGLALLGAVTVVLSRTAESIIMPIAMSIRTVPLVAMTPLIALIFGRGFLTLIVVSGVVTFFPALVTIVGGIRSVPPSACEVVTVSGGGPVKVLRIVQLPAALPSFFAAARVTAPLAMTGALLCEWLATGDGAGFMMLRAGVTGNYSLMWSLVALVTLSAAALYGIAAILEGTIGRIRS